MKTILDGALVVWQWWAAANNMIKDLSAGQLSNLSVCVYRRRVHMLHRVCARTTRSRMGS